MSLSFLRPDERTFMSFARQVAIDCEGYHSHEAVAQHIAEAFVEEFTNDGETELALFRIFRLCQVNELPEELQALVSSDERFVMALTGTYGIVDAWCDRRTSANHKVISINDLSIPSRIPMFEAILVNGMKVDFEQLYATGDVLASTSGLAGMFHVADVPNSPQHIPAQEEFVQPYGIQSEVGFGSVISGSRSTDTPSISLYTVFAFSRVPISDEGAHCFYQMRPALATALAGREAIFEG